MRSPPKGMVLLVASVLLVAIAAVGTYLCGNVYLVIETDGHGGSAIWHDDECFIFMGQQVSGKVIRRYEAVLESALQMNLVRPERLQDDLAVFHIKGDRLDRYVVKDFGSGGGAFPFQDRVYFSRGGEPADYPYVWEWTGTNFDRVPKPKAEAILESFPPAGGIAHSVTAHIASQGWEVTPSIIFRSTQEMRYPMRSGNRSLVLVASGIRASTLVLEGRLGADSRDVLWAIERWGYRKISKSEYQKLKAGRVSSM